MESKRPITPEDLAMLYRLDDPQVSPDGTQVAFVVGEQSRAGLHDLQAIWLVPVEGNTPARRFTQGDSSDRAPRWSPDGRFLAFLSDRAAPGTAQPYLIPSSGGEARRLASVPGQVEDLRWSPDGTMLALCVTDGETDEELRRKKERDDTVVFGEDLKFSRIWVLRLADQTFTALADGSRHAVSLAWSPDSRRIAVLSLESPEADATYLPARIALHAVDGSGETVLSHVHGHSSHLVWSPDGTMLAFQGPEGSVSCDSAINLLPLSSGEPRLLQPGYRGAVEWIAWLPDSTSLLVSALEGLASTVLRLPIDPAQQPEVLLPEELRGRGYIEDDLHCSADGQTIALIRSQADAPPELYAGRAGALRPRTSFGALAGSTWAMGRVETLHWRGPGELPISGLLIYPASYVPGRHYPLVLLIHGGPAWHWAEYFPTGWAQLLSSNGYAVLLPNPRGSTGSGASFTDGNAGDYGGAELEDSLCGVDAAIDRGVADPERLGVGGWSHGGYMTAWAVTQTDRFKAAVMGAGMANLLSDQGQNDIPRMNDDYFPARSYDDPEAYLWRSPIFHVRRVTTPTLVVHGASDPRVHPAQGREFFAALRQRGVPTAYVTFPREEHQIKERAHYIDLLRRVLEWYDRYLKDDASTSL